MTPSTEILVHVSAPSRGPDDARYRREALELLGFEPANAHHLLSGKRRDESVWTSLEPMLKQATPIVCEKTPLQRPSKPCQELPSSLLEQFEQATPYGKGTSSVGCNTSVKPLMPPPWQSKTSSTSSTTRGRHHPVPATPNQPVTPTLVSISEHLSSSCHAESDSWRTPPSVIPDSQPVRSTSGRQEGSSSPYRKRAIRSDSSLSPIQTRDHRDRKRRRRQLNSCGTSVDCQEATPDKPRLDFFPQKIEQGLEFPHTYDKLPLEIHPPRPLPSLDHFDSHVTPPLRGLRDRLPLADLFKPSSQAHSLDQLERGHWYVQSGAWDEARKVKFWHFLSAFIGDGKAGWGVWCCRELEGNDANSGSSKENKAPPAEDEIVKIFCWGEVVQEIWLLLWLASAKRIIGTGAKWVDAQGETVIQML